jgi:hypothetical protein
MLADASEDSVVAVGDVKRALDNCMWEHAWVQERRDIPPDAQALLEAYMTMTDRKLSDLPKASISGAALAALARWKDHRRTVV